MSFCPDEKRFLVKPRWSGWQLWSVAEGGPTREFDVGFSYGNVVAFHPDGRTFITGGSGQNIFMFDLDGFLRESILLPGHSVLFGVHREYFKDGRGIRTYFLFRKSKDGGALERYGSPLDLQFHWADIPDGR